MIKVSLLTEWAGFAVSATMTRLLLSGGNE